MCPNIPDRPEDQLSIQAEYAVNAGRRALEVAGRAGEDVDLVVLGCSNLQRMYPAIAIEVQEALGARGYGFDILARLLGRDRRDPARVAGDPARPGQVRARRDPRAHHRPHELARARQPLHLRRRLGGARGRAGDRARPGSWEILSTRMMSKWSSNIRNNRGLPRSLRSEHREQHRQAVPPERPPGVQGRGAARREVHLRPPRRARSRSRRRSRATGCTRPTRSMNELIAKWMLGRDATREEAPIILDEYGNTASAGLADRVLALQRRPAGGQLRRDGVVRRRLLARLAAAAPAVTATATATPPRQTRPSHRR